MRNCNIFYPVFTSFCFPTLQETALWHCLYWYTLNFVVKPSLISHTIFFTWIHRYPCFIHEVIKCNTSSCNLPHLSKSHVMRIKPSISNYTYPECYIHYFIPECDAGHYFQAYCASTCTKINKLNNGYPYFWRTLFFPGCVSSENYPVITTR